MKVKCPHCKQTFTINRSWLWHDGGDCPACRKSYARFAPGATIIIIGVFILLVFTVGDTAIKCHKNDINSELCRKH